MLIAAVNYEHFSSQDLDVMALRTSLTSIHFIDVSVLVARYESER